MLYNLIAIVAGVAAIVVYMKGVKYDKAWGTPLMTIFVLGAVVALILPRATVTRTRQREARVRRHEYLLAIGDRLGRHLEGGENVLIISEPEMGVQEYESEISMLEREMQQAPGDEIERLQQAVERARERKETLKEEKIEVFRMGSGVNVNLVGVTAPWRGYRRYDASVFNELLEEYENQQIDVVISAIGIPSRGPGQYELEALEIFNWPDPPLFAANLEMEYDPDRLRSYMEEGLLAAVALFTDERAADLVGIDLDNIDELPASPLW